MYSATKCTLKMIFLFNKLTLRRNQVRITQELCTISKFFCKSKIIPNKKFTLLHCWQECKLVQPLWRIVWRFLKKLKTELPCDPAILLLGIYLKKTMVQKDSCTPMFTVVLFTIAKTWKQPKCPSTDEWIKKMWYTLQWTITQPLKRMK